MFQIVRERLEIEVLSQEQVELQLPSLVTLKMERKPESDFLVEAEEPFQVSAEPWLVLSLEVEELTSPSSRQVTYGTR